MLSQPFLEALRAAFWPVYILAIVCGAIAALRSRKWCLGRATLALITASVAQTLWEGVGYLHWWQHLAIDFWVFTLIVMPPRNKWQSIIGGMVFAQIVLHCLWAMEPDFGRMHWLANILIGFAKCFVLLLWSGGGRVEILLGRAARLANQLVLASPLRKLAG